jgi:hypothetical protein
MANNSDPIVPDVGLGGYQARARLVDIQTDFRDLAVHNSGLYELVDAFEARYIIGRGEVTVSVDARNGKVIKVIAGLGYRGALFGRIRVGLKVFEARKIDPRLYLDYTWNGFAFHGVDGVFIDVDDPDPDDSFAWNMPIKSITVYAKEAFETAEGRMGLW